MGLLGGVKYVSNHGSSQGIITRFFIHFEKMMEMGFMGDRYQAANERYLRYEQRNQEDFTNFYDTFHEIIELRDKYIEGIRDGKYFRALPNNDSTSDITPEITIRKRIKEFFISGKQLLNNFAKSELLDDGVFQVSRFLFADDNKIDLYLNQNSASFTYQNGYKKIVELVREAQHGFKHEFLNIRNLLEHDYNVTIPPFNVQKINEEIVIQEPEFNGQNIFSLIELYYNGTLDLIEDMAAYFYGVNACANTDGKITLFKNLGRVDPSKFRYRYTITLDVNDNTLQRLISARPKTK